MAFVVRPGSRRCLRPSTGRSHLAERVREISRPREDVGAGAEPDVFVATACAVVTVVTKPAGEVTEIIASEIASPTESWFSSPPELHRPTQAVPLVQRLAVQLQGPLRDGR